MKIALKLTAVLEEADEVRLMAFVEELTGVNIQDETLNEAKVNLKEALELVMDTRRMLS